MLYDKSLERDNCGFGLIAHIEGEPSHKVVRTAIHALARMQHRGAILAETTVIPLKGFVVQHISEPPQALRTPSDTDCAQAQKEHGDGVYTSHSPSLNPFRIGTQV